MKKMITLSLNKRAILSLKNQLRVCCGLFLMLLVSTVSLGQDCLQTFAFGSVAPNPDGSVTQIITGQWAGDVAEVTGIESGNTYEFTASLDRYVTVTSGSADGDILGSGFVPFSVVSTSDENLYVHWSLDADCSTSAEDFTSFVQCTTCELECIAPELGVAAFEIGGQSPIEGCLEEGTPWLISLGVSGGSGNSAYNIFLDGEDIDQQVLAGGSTTIGGLVAGDFVEISLVGADDANCGVAQEIGVEACPPPAPENDEPCNAIDVVCGETYIGSNVSANPAPDGQFCDFSSTSGTVWYEITPDFNGFIQIETCLEGTDFDTDSHVFTGSCDDLICYDGYGGNGHIDGDSGCEFTSWSTGGEFAVENGVTYYIMIDGFGSAEGNFELLVTCTEVVCESPELSLSALDATGAPIEDCLDLGGEFFVVASISGGSGNGSYSVSANGGEAVLVDSEGSSEPLGPFAAGSSVAVSAIGDDDDACGAEASISTALCPPSNDDICDAIEIACDQPIDGSTLGASFDEVGLCGTSNTAPGVWYNITPDFNGFIEFSTCDAADFDTKISVFSAENCEDELVCIGGNDDGSGCSGFTSKLEVAVESGVQYFVLVHGFSSAVGNFTLSTSCEEILPCEDTEYNVIVDGGIFDFEVSWNLLLDGEVVADGGAPITDEVLCLADGCYTLELFDSFGDGWNGNEFSLFLGDELVAGPFTLEDGSEGIAEFGLGDVVCGEPGCENYEYYLADILEDGTTNIYEVSLSGSEAALSLIATSEIEVHIALNEDNGLLYAVSKADGSFRVLDPLTGDFGPVELLDTEVSEIVGAAFNADGKLLILSQSENAIYSVMLGSNEVSVFDSYSPSLGGDIDFGSDGALYLATREGFGTFYIAIPDEIASDILVGDAPQLVTGVADTEAGNLIFSHRDATTLEVREYDGSVGAPYDITLGGEPFMTFNGDLASGCADNRQILEDCEQVIYYTNQPPGSGDYTLYSVVLNGDGTSTSTELLSGLGSSHIGVTPDGSTIYMVGGTNLITYDTESASIVNTVNIVSDGGANLSGFPACVVTDDGTLYIGGSGNNVWTLDPATGIATQFASININGGDLIEAPTGENGEGELWVVTRGNNTFTRVSDGLSFTVPVPEINGAAVLENGNVLLANGDGDAEDGFIEVSLADASIVASYDTDYNVNNGDLAATCIDPNPNTSNPCLAEGACNATSVVYVEGTTQGGGSLSPMRTNPDNALGAPEGTDELVFTTLGYGGSLTFEFDGVVLNGEGDDIIVVETSFGNPGCEVYPEYADVSVSADGEDFYYIGTVCKSDNAVDISAAEVALDCVSYVRVANNDGQTETGDGFDVDGIIAIHNCEEIGDVEGDDGAGIVANENSNNTLSSFPNPTNGPSVAVFVTGQTERATLEVYDMNGRMVEGLFSGMAEEGVEYRIDFDGLSLPNGVYMYRLTTDSETVVEKFMIAK